MANLETISGLVELSQQAAQGTDVLWIMEARFAKQNIRVYSFGFSGSPPFVCEINGDREHFPTFAQAFAFAMDAYDKTLAEGSH